MGLLDNLDPDKLICSFCGAQPVVGFTFTVDAANIDEVMKDKQIALEDKSLIAVCKEHLPILKEQMEQEGIPPEALDFKPQDGESNE